jgi:hypothetical protein
VREKGIIVFWFVIFLDLGGKSKRNVNITFNNKLFEYLEYNQRTYKNKFLNSETFKNVRLYLHRWQSEEGREFGRGGPEGREVMKY